MKSDIYHADYETYSEADIGDVGSYRYSEDPSTEILMMAISKNDEPVYLWVHPRWRDVVPGLHEPESEEVVFELDCDPQGLLYAHNAMFERAVTRYVDDSPIRFMRDRQKQWRCTAAMARRAAIPDSLDKATSFLKLGEKKDSRGKALIRLFSMPQTSGKRKGQRVLPSEEPEKFREFCEYCKQDVVAEKALHKALASFELVGPAVLDTFLLDVALNDRGVPVNMKALKNAEAIITFCMREKVARFQEITGLVPTRRAAVKEWLEKHGLPLDNMQGETLEAVIKDAKTPEVSEVLKLYVDLSFAAVKKVNAFLSFANSDGRMRGTMLYHGAGTGRWSSRGPQIQNVKKPTLKNLEGAFAMIERGCDAEDLDLIYGEPLEVIASCIRNFITATLDADYNAIEARILPWMAGQDDAIARFRKFDSMAGDTTERRRCDPYRVMAAVIFNKAAEDTTDQERQLGKIVVLGAGYQMGKAKFLATCHSWGLDWVTQTLADRCIDAFRSMNPKIKQLWYDLNDAAIRAVAQPGRRFSAGLISFCARHEAGLLYLFMRLPSGRDIAYPDARIERDQTFDRDQVTYHGQLPASVLWGRIKMYGGKWAENADQGIAADVMAFGCGNAMNEGYDVWGLIHDQGLGTHKPGQTAPGFGKALAVLPPWAGGLPLKAEAKITKYYAK